MKLKPGTKAPLFVMEDFTRNTVDLSAYKGKKVLLSFFRGAACPFCNLRVHELIKKYPELKEQGLEVITFFTATKEEIQKYAGKRNPPFPVIPDPEFTICEKYGIESSIAGMFKAMLRMGTMLKMMTGGFFNLKSISDKPVLPADFLMDENGVVYQSYYGSDYGDHIGLNEITKWVNAK